MSELRPLQKTDLFTLVETTFGASTTAQRTEGIRHAAQLSAIPDHLRGSDVVERRFNEQAVKPFCGFNLMIALEWVPSVETLAALKTALSEASRLLFDVTDGYMALGQVLLGGMELMPCADIQIFASNRLFPRSSVNAMNDPEKYRPIRAGRGLWDKNNRATIAWSTRAGYATLVHELGHHALGLKDQYLGSEAGLIVPQQSLVKDTIMASLESSELLAPRQNRQDRDPTSEWEALRQNSVFSWLGISPTYKHDTVPPVEPLPDLGCFMTSAMAGLQQELLLVLDALNLQAGDKSLDLGHCWVYLLRMGADNLPVRLIPQGSFESRPDGFRLLGAQIEDRVLLCGSERGSAGTPLHLWATIRAVEGISAVLDAWQDATPTAWEPVSVAAEGVGPVAPYVVTLTNPVPSRQELTFPLGTQDPVKLKLRPTLTLLDGYVLLIATEPKWEVEIASYSLGGSTASAYPAHPNPIPAGSPDGNAMLFFYDSKAQLGYSNAQKGEISTTHPERYLILTTINHFDATPLPQATAPALNPEPRSYIFTIASNLPMNDLADYSPTLVLYYDQGSRDDPTDELLIYRYNDLAQQWDELKTSQGLKASDDKRERFFVAAPLNATTAPVLFQNPPQPERYRLFLKRKPTGGGTQ